MWFLFFYIKLSSVLSRSVKKCVKILLGIALNLHIAFGKMAIFSCFNPTDQWAKGFFPSSSIFFFFKTWKFLSFGSSFALLEILHIIYSYCEGCCFPNLFSTYSSVVYRRVTVLFFSEFCIQIWHWRYLSTVGFPW